LKIPKIQSFPKLQKFQSFASFPKIYSPTSFPKIPIICIRLKNFQSILEFQKKIQNTNPFTFHFLARPVSSFGCKCSGVVISWSVLVDCA
jgi:hypothetical protein